MTSVVLRDETAATDLISESMADPVIVYPTAGWEADANNAAIGRRLAHLALQAQIYVGPGATGHTYTTKKNGAVVGTFAPPAAFTGRVLRLYISGVLQGTEVFNAGQGEAYAVRRQHLTLDHELNPTHTFTDLAS